MTINKKLYAKRDLRGLGLHYTKHVSAMTSEELFLKSDIAAELAWRDMEIDRLRAEKEAAEGQAAERERGRIKDILCLLPCASHGGVLPNGKIPAAILVSDIFAVLKEGLQTNK